MKLALIVSCFLPPVAPAFAQAPVPASGWGTGPHDVSNQISAYIRCIFQDRDGHYWFGTNGDGVARYDGKQLAYVSLDKGLPGSAVRDIIQTADGAMWFGSDAGVTRLLHGSITTYTAADGLPSAEIWSMLLDSAGTLWVGTADGVARWVNAVDADAPAKRGEQPFVPLPIPPAGVENTRWVWDMCEDKSGAIWFAIVGDGARRYDGEKVTAYTTRDGLVGNEVRCVFADSRGRVWIGADHAGVSCFDGTSFRNYTSEDGLANNRVFRVYEDRSGALWFSTLGAGVTRYDGTTFTAYPKLGTLTHVQSILQDAAGTLWFGCSGGLFRLDGETFINVTKDGPWR